MTVHPIFLCNLQAEDLNPTPFQFIVQFSSSEILIEELNQTFLWHFQKLKCALILDMCLNENVLLYSGRTSDL